MQYVNSIKDAILHKYFSGVLRQRIAGVPMPGAEMREPGPGTSRGSWRQGGMAGGEQQQRPAGNNKKCFQCFQGADTAVLAVLAGSGEGRGVAGPRTCASQHRQHSTLATKTPRKVICTPATSLKKRRSVCCGEESSRQPRLGGYITLVREASRRQDWARPGQWQWARHFCGDFSLCKVS